MGTEIMQMNSLKHYKLRNMLDEIKKYEVKLAQLIVY